MVELTARLVFIPLGYGPNVAAGIARREAVAALGSLEPYAAVDRSKE
jgi:hypothetical protein